MRTTICRLAEFETTSPHGNAGLVGFFNRTTPSRYPSPLPPMVFGTEIAYEPSESGRTAKVEVVVIDEDGHRVLTITRDVELYPTGDGSEGRAWISHTFGTDEPPVIPGPGEYRFDVLVDGHLVAYDRLVFASLA
jgi:hypothetical protein